MKKSTRQNHGFAVRLGKMHGKVFFRKNDASSARRAEDEENILSCVVEKTTASRIFVVHLFGCTTKSLFVVRFFFVVRPIENARQMSYLPCARNKCTVKILTHDKRRFSRSVWQIAIVQAEHETPCSSLQLPKNFGWRY
jgi:hypothetical protein